MSAQQWLSIFCFLNGPSRADLAIASASSDHNTFRFMRLSRCLLRRASVLQRISCYDYRF
ncbi:unnamed protein product [Callosobruchus maculatus]|uniref:Uncharacterized protein n=1 Tax=Callosobruchus maculatus TaxID=64391 RepID=A0A653CY21_CALMS|nr:unnamed protein product [Callosobruchus maculatus]